MKVYTCSQPGISCRDGKILLGEEGRGRRLATVPVPAGAEYTDRKESAVYVVVDATTGQELNRRDGDAAWAAGAIVGGKYAYAYEGPAARLVEEPHWNAWLVQVTVPGEGANEVLLRIPDMSGFRGSSSSTAKAGAVKVAEGYNAQGDAGRMGGGMDTLWRVADGGTVIVRRSGRRIEWSEGHYTNVGGTIVFRDPAKESAIDAAVSALGGAAPTITNAEREAAHAQEVARQQRDLLAKEAADNAARTIEDIRAETCRLQSEARELERRLQEVRNEQAAQARVEAAKKELGNGFGNAFAALGM